MRAIEQIQQQLHPAVEHFINWAAFGAAMGWVFGTAVPAIVGVMSGIWLGLQIWLFVFIRKPWKRGGGNGRD